MSTAVLPNLKGLGFDVTRTEIFNNIVQQAVSGKRTAIGLWSYPRHQRELKYNFLRGDAANLEFSQLAGFFNLRRGTFDTFLYSDPDDNTVTGQQIATGDGSTITFQMIRTFGGASEPILAPHTVSAVYLNGVAQVSGWTVSNWGSTTPGVLTFTSAPANGVAITADFTYYFPCRFDDDSMTFTKFLHQIWKADKVTFSSEK